jgi:hypothetical protein
MALQRAELSGVSVKGRFKPKNPLKYMGDPTKIIYRSSWELKLMNFLDSHTDVLKWASEEFCIPYISPIDNKVHRYFPDFLVKKRNPNKVIQTIVIEVKPKSQSSPPSVQKKATKRYVREVYTWGVNPAKWEAAKKYCEHRGWEFMVMNEEHLGIKF